MEKKKDLPYLPFYIGDWRKAPDIRGLSLEERGLWFEMLCLMWESPRRGFLTIDGITPIDDKTLARIIGEDVFVITKIKQVLERCYIYSIEEDTNIIYNRRMVKDEALRVSRSIAGKKGMNSRYKQQLCYNKDTNKDTNKTITNTDIDIDIDIVNEKIFSLENINPKSNKKLPKNANKKLYLEVVYLTNEEYQKLLTRFGQEQTTAMIDNLNTGISSKGYKYDSHYHTILSWHNRDEKRAKEKAKSATSGIDEYMRERGIT